jgi:hypothetical protein
MFFESVILSNQLSWLCLPLDPVLLQNILAYLWPCAPTSEHPTYRLFRQILPPPRSFGQGISVIIFVSSFDTLWISTSWKWGSAAKTNSLSLQRTESYTTPSSQSLYRLRYQPAIRLTVIYTEFFDITSAWRYVPILATRGRSLLTYHSLPIHWEIILECSWSLYCSHIHTGVFIFQDIRL